MSNPQKQGADRGKETVPKTRLPGPVNQGPETFPEEPDLLTLQRALADAAMADTESILVLQRRHGNRALSKLITERAATEGSRRGVQRYEEAHTIQRDMDKAITDADKAYAGGNCFQFAAMVVLTNAYPRRTKSNLGQASQMTNARADQMFKTDGTEVTTKGELESYEAGSVIGIKRKGSPFGYSSHVVVKKDRLVATGHNHPAGADPADLTTTVFNADGGIGGTWDATAIRVIPKSKTLGAVQVAVSYSPEKGHKFG